MVIIFFLVFYVIFAPLIGVILVENGWYSISAGLEGYSNGAWLIYLLHSVFLLLGIIFVYKIQIRNRYYISSIRHHFNTNKVLFKSLLILLLFLILMLFLFKGYLTLTSVVEKGTFRSQTIGIFGLGFLAFYIIKFFVPSVLTYAVYTYKIFSNQTASPLKFKRFFIIILFFLASLTGLMWGYKSSAVVVLLPSLIVIYLDKTRFKSIFIVFLVFFIVIYVSAYFFDRDNPYNFSLIEFIFLRMTVIEGDTFWRVYDLVKNNEVYPLGLDYFKFLIETLGNKVFSTFIGSDPDRIIEYKFSSYLTYIVAGDIFQATSGEHNLTGTVASEGLLFLGPYWMFIFSFISGVIAGLNIRLIKLFYILKKPKLLSISSTCFVFLTWSWLKGGGIATLFHISNFFGIIATYFLLILIEKKLKLL